MNKFKRLYIVPFLLALVSAIVLIQVFFSIDQYWKAAVTVLIPLLILGIGFRIITIQRMKMIRLQLYQILQTLEEFDIDEPTKVKFEASVFPIFNELNEYLKELINRIRDHYHVNKQFTQNASHELQTPLAVIKGHVELLLQSSRLGEREIEVLAIILHNTNRLSKINSALILLSKIENQRFADTEKVNFNTLTQEVMRHFYDLLQMHELKINLEEKGVFEIEMSAILAEILITNLLQNAIRHNEGTMIDIQIQKDFFQIVNLGKPLTIAPEKLFKRFKRQSTKEESLGLGLSIVQRICEQSGLEIRYVFEKKWHRLIIKPKNLVGN